MDVRGLAGTKTEAQGDDDEQRGERTVRCCAVDSSPLITGGCPEKSLPAGGICAGAKWT